MKLTAKYDFNQFNPKSLTIATDEPLAILISSASFGANRSYGGPKVRLPLRMRRVKEGDRPRLASAQDGSMISLPPKWSVVVYCKRSLRIESVETDGEIIRLDGDNFAVLLALVDTRAIVAVLGTRNKGSGRPLCSLMTLLCLSMSPIPSSHTMKSPVPTGSSMLGRKNVLPDPP